MTWVWLAISVLSSTAGDVLTAKGMAEHGEIEEFSPKKIVQVLRYMSMHRLILIGIVCNAVSFFTFMALLSVSELSFAVPATALAYILKTGLAEWYLEEDVGFRRWSGAIFITIGVVLISF